MISFIVIGKNIEHTVELCMNSINRCIDNHKLLDTEIIYVDSKSTDKTLQIIKRNYPKIKLISIVGETNAAVGRNVGAIESAGNDLIFLDGDMELNSEFIQNIVDNEGMLKYDFASGNITHYLYDSNWKYVNAFNMYKKDKDHVGNRLGGAAFVVKKELWKKIGGMNTHYVRSEDMDFWFRLSKIGYPLLIKKEVMGIHHTISYYNKNRFLKMILNGSYLYSGVFVRSNILDRRIIKYCIQNFSTAILLMGALLFCIFKIYYLLLGYPLLIIIRSFRKQHKENKTILFHIGAYFIYDFMFIIGFLFFYPKKAKLNYNINGK